MSRYYDIDAANARIEELRPLLASLRDDRAAVAEMQRGIERLAEADGDAGHDASLQARQQEIVAVVRRMQATVRQLDDWGVALRDISTGLVDFPALVNGRPIWLCWQLGEGPIEWWHEIDTGKAGRKRLMELR